jgi:hypothetical protein
VISEVSAFQEFRMILAQVIHAKIAAAQNQRNMMVMPKVPLHSDCRGERA